MRVFKILDYQWIRDYLENNENEPGNRKTDVMFTFLSDAGMTAKRKLTSFGEFICNKGLEKADTWALIICNLVYTPQFNWWIMNTKLNYKYSANELDDMLKGSLTDNSKKNVLSTCIIHMIQ